MKSFLVDVPVRIKIWTRPETQKKQFEIIREVRPSVLFIQSDGGRNESEWDLIKENRELYDSRIDWKCTVHKMYLDENHGMYGSEALGMKQVFSEVDRCIFTEDDDLMSLSFIPFCEELLERYKDDLRVGAISGSNPFKEYDTPADYFFTRAPGIHGIAFWKRFYKSMMTCPQNIDNYYMRNIHNISAEDRMGRRFDDVFTTGKNGNHIPWVEFFLPFNAYSQNQLYITPSKNLITNVGVGKEATHSGDYRELPKVTREYFMMTKSYELSFPLKHPEYMVRDVEYERKMKKLLGYDPVTRTVRDLEKLFLAVKYRDWERIKNKVKEKSNPRWEK